MEEYTEETKMALAWFKKNNISAYIDTDKTSIYIKVNDIDILISGSEISYRADLYKMERKINNRI